MPTPLRGLAERQSCATRSLRKAILRYGCYERHLKGISVLRRPAERQSYATRSLRKAILRYGRSKRPFKGQSVLREAGRGAHPGIWHKTGRSPLKFAWRRVNPRQGSKPRRACRATRELLKAILCYERAVKGKPVLREGFSRQSCATRGLLKAILCYERAFKGNPVLREGL